MSIIRRVATATIILTAALAFAQPDTAHAGSKAGDRCANGVTVVRAKWHTSIPEPESGGRVGLTFTFTDGRGFNTFAPAWQAAEPVEFTTQSAGQVVSFDVFWFDGDGPLRRLACHCDNPAHLAVRGLVEQSHRVCTAAVDQP